jgi:putative phage-type endonuclease
MREIDLAQGSDLWLQFRKKYIGASDAGIIMGESPYATPYQLWVRKKGLIPEPMMTSAMQRGKDLEPLALMEFEEKHNIFMAPKVFVSDEYPWMMASMDGVSLDGKIAVEIKCPGRETHEMALAGTVPKKYIWQLQHQMIVMKLDSMLYFSFDGQKGVTLVVKRDLSLCDKLISVERAFWSSILNDEPPELNERDYTQKTDQNWLDMANRWKQIRNQIKELEQDEENTRSALLYLANQQNAEGGGIRVQTSYRKGRVDYNQIPELSGIDLEQYRKPSTQTFCVREV